MLAETTEIVEITEVSEKTRYGKRLMVAALLTAAAIGVRYLPERAMIVHEDDKPRVAVVETSDDASRPTVGQNTLFGDAVVSSTVDSAGAFSVAGAGLSGTRILERDMVVEKAGITPSIESAVAALTELGASEGAGSTGIDVKASAASVPEPSSAGVFALALIPALALRRPRRRKSA